MAPKRKAQEAFGKTNGQLSAFAAARLAKQSRHVPATEELPEENDPSLDAVGLAQAPYDDHHEVEMSDVDAGSVDIVVAATPKSTTTLRLSSPRLEKDSITGGLDKSLKITIRNEQTVTCVGEYDLKVLEGVAIIYGAVLVPSSTVQRVYAASTHALPCITGRRSGTVIQLFHVNSTIRNLANLSPLFRNIWLKETYQIRTFAVLDFVADDELQRSLIPLETDKTTEAVLSRLATEAESTARLTRIMAVGAKSSGKSTFNRMLCNSLISKPSVRKVLYLDLDPGQPELGPPGIVSLVEVTTPILGPPFTHPASPHSSCYRLLRTHAIAATSFKDDPEHYMACARELVQHADRQYPLIVNSCGWVGGLGATVLRDLAQSLNITQVVLMEPLDASFADILQASCSDAAFHRLGRQPIRPVQRTPAESRSMQTTAYFHHKIGKAGRDVKWSSKPIAIWRPWLIGYHGSHKGLQTVISYGTNPHPDFLAEVLDGSIVALVRVDDDHEHEAYNLKSYGQSSVLSSNCRAEDANDLATTPNLIQLTREGLPYMPPSGTGACISLDPRYSECVGLALVRAVDTETKTLQLVTPLSESQIANLMDDQIAIVRGSFDAPGWAYFEDLYDGERDSARRELDRPWVSRAEPVGVEGAVWRLRHPPMAADVRQSRY